MANMIVSYDLNGPHPSHTDVDELLRRTGLRRGRILETVWWLDYPGTVGQLFEEVNAILRPEDRLVVCECAEASWHNLLVTDESLLNAWQDARRAA